MLVEFENIGDVLDEILTDLEEACIAAGIACKRTGGSIQSCSQYYTLDNVMEVRISDHAPGGSALSVPDYGINVGDWTFADTTVDVRKVYRGYTIDGSCVECDAEGFHLDGDGDVVDYWHDGYLVDVDTIKSAVEAAVNAAQAARIAEDAEIGAALRAEIAA